MEFATPLIRATLLRRYNRFLSDIRLEDGTEARAHCPNPGSMMGLKDPGTPIWVEPNDDPKKKLKYGWRLSELPGGQMVCIDTSMPNRVVGEALHAGQVVELAGYSKIRAEVPYGTKSRVDFVLTDAALADAYVEVKNVTLRRAQEWAEFPDSVTTRGAKHLRELADVVAAGHRAVMLYLVQRTDCRRLRMAADLDPAYAAAFDAAREAGVEMLCYSTHISAKGVWLSDALPVELHAHATG